MAGAAAVAPAMSELSGAILKAPAGTVYFIRTGNIYDDSALGFVYSKCSNPQNIISQIDRVKIDQTTGAPLFTGNIVVCGGCAASKAVSYYEGLGCVPITFSMDITRFKFMRGSAIAYSVSRSNYDHAKADYFVLQIYANGSRTVLSMWGITHTGTYASGVYFTDHVYPNLPSLTQGYYVCKWTDLNNDGIQQSTEIAVVAAGDGRRETIKALHLGPAPYEKEHRPLFTDEYLGKMRETGFNSVKVFLIAELQDSMYQPVNLDNLLQDIARLKQLGWGIWVSPTFGRGPPASVEIPSYTVFKTAYLDFIRTYAKVLEDQRVEYLSPCSEVEVLFKNQGWSSDELERNLTEFWPLAVSTARQYFSGRIIHVVTEIERLRGFLSDAFFKDLDIAGVNIGTSPGVSEENTRRKFQACQTFANLARCKMVPWMVSEYWWYETEANELAKQEELKDAQIALDAYCKAMPKGVGFTWNDVGFETFALQPYGEATRQALKNFFSKI